MYSPGANLSQEITSRYSALALRPCVLWGTEPLGFPLPDKLKFASTMALKPGQATLNILTLPLREGSARYL